MYSSRTGSGAGSTAIAVCIFAISIAMKRDENVSFNMLKDWYPRLGIEY
jgi:hypothetical protein